MNMAIPMQTGHADVGAAQHWKRSRRDESKPVSERCYGMCTIGAAIQENAGDLATAAKVSARRVLMASSQPREPATLTKAKVAARALRELVSA
jgi:hypothetical protein